MESTSSINYPLLTYNSLYNLDREEKKIKILQELPEEFYKALDKFFIDKKKNLEKLKNENDLDKIKKEKNILKNSEKLSKEILNLRCIKISTIAIQNQIYGENTLNPINMIDKEKEFYISIKKLMEKMNN